MLGHSMLMASNSILKKVVFDSASKVSGYSIRSESPSISYDSTNVGMRIVASGGQNFVAYDAWGSFPRGVAFSMVVKLVSDSESLKHFGFFTDSGASGVKGYRLCNLDGDADVTKWVSSSYTNITGTETKATNITVGGLYTFKAVLKADGTIELWIDDVLYWSGSDSTYTSVRPGFFVYGSTILVKSLTVEKV